MLQRLDLTAYRHQICCSDHIFEDLTLVFTFFDGFGRLVEVITVDIQHGACLKGYLLCAIVLLMNYNIQKRRSHKFYLILYSVFQKKMLFFRHFLCMKL